MLLSSANFLGKLLKILGMFRFGLLTPQREECITGSKFVPADKMEQYWSIREFQLTRCRCFSHYYRPEVAWFVGDRPEVGTAA